MCQTQGWHEDSLHFERSCSERLKSITPQVRDAGLPDSFFRNLQVLFDKTRSSRALSSMEARLVSPTVAHGLSGASPISTSDELKSSIANGISNVLRLFLIAT